MSCYLGQFNVLTDEIVREVMEGCVRREDVHYSSGNSAILR